MKILVGNRWRWLDENNTKTAFYRHETNLFSEHSNQQQKIVVVIRFSWKFLCVLHMLTKPIFVPSSSGNQFTGTVYRQAVIVKYIK